MRVNLLVDNILSKLKRYLFNEENRVVGLMFSLTFSSYFPSLFFPGGMKSVSSSSSFHQIGEASD
jgi:hypothetical protein